MLSYKDVFLTYRGTAVSVKALSHFSLDIDPGEPVAIIGPSGCGKSTALLLAAGLLQPTDGEVSIAASKVTKPRFETALILQDFGLLPWKTVYDNAALGLRVRKFKRSEIRQRTEKALQQAELADFARLYPAELSGGMRQRLALARALALDVNLLLMDEPLSALDALLREQLQDLLLQLWRTSAYAQVLVTHSIEEAVFLGRRIIIMSQRPGRVAHIVDNPGMGSTDFRGEAAFYTKCQEVRAVLTAQSLKGAGVAGADVATGANADAGVSRA